MSAQRSLYHVYLKHGHRYGIRATSQFDACRRALTLWPRRYLDRVEWYRDLK